jgi:4-amino-4-deoxy-L-arabinose transferase-like glycosyltransferase
VSSKLQLRDKSTARKKEKISGWAPRWPVLVVVVVIVFFSLIRLRLRNMPLERDEGEYAYVGQLMLQGIPPYELAYNMKLPGTYAAYSIVMAIFGQSPAGIHVGLILVNAAAVILIFLLVRRLFGELAAAVSAATYGLLSTTVAVLGFAGHATHFVVLAALGGILLLLKAIDTQRMRFYFFAGFLLGIGFVMKQPGIAFTTFGAFYLVVNEWPTKSWLSVRRLTVYSAGAVLPFALTCLALFCTGDLGKMWFWTISYARQYASVTNLWSGTENLFEMGSQIIEPFYLVWILAVLGLVALIWDSTVWKRAWFVAGFVVFSCGSVCAGFYFRPHYFILVLPAASMLVGIAVASGTRELSRLSRNSLVATAPAVAFVIVVAISLTGESGVLFRLDPVAICRAAYGEASPFPEAEIVAAYVKQHTRAEDRIAVLGSEPEIYFYSRRHSATGYLYTYPFFEPQSFATQMQKEMISEIERNHPEYIVFVGVRTSWQIRPTSNTYILDWFRNYSAANYELVGIADEVRPETRYVWGDAVKDYRTESDSSLEIFKRKKT